MNEQLAAIKARRDAVTPGVWGTVRASNDVRIWVDEYIIALFPDTMPYYTTAHNADADAEFCAAAPGDVDTLLAMVERLADESLMWELRHDKRNEQLAAVTAERDALAAQLAQADDFGADCYEWGLDNKTWRPNFAEWLQWKREKA